jgi:hypothetical protein
MEDIPDGPDMELEPLPATRARLSWPIRLALVIATVALAAILAVTRAGPEDSGRRLARNDRTAIAMMTVLSSAQSKLLAASAIDGDRDGIGEFGFVHELRETAHDSVETLTRIPLLGEAWTIGRDGCVHRSGYRVRAFLPGPGSTWVAESGPSDGSRARVDVDRCESSWLAYAWPERWGQTGVRAFLVTQDGDVLVHGNYEARYEGDRAPEPGRSGFLRDGSGVAVRVEDALGDVWSVTR